METFKHGLEVLSHDERDIKLGSFVILPKLSELPKRYVFTPPFPVKNQRDSDFCTQFATCGASELQEWVELSPEWGFQASKLRSGNVESYGQDLRVALSVHQDYGALEKSQSPYNLDTKDPEFLRNPLNWPRQLFQKALIHQKKSYAFISGPYDHFDNIRATIWKFKNERRGVIFGTLFGWPLNQKYMEQMIEPGPGHCMYSIGWDGNYLVVVNSGGEEAGDKGRHYFSRETINRAVSLFGAAMFIDKTPEEIKYMVDNNIKYNDNWIVQLLKALAAIFKRPVPPVNAPAPVKAVAQPIPAPVVAPVVKTPQQRLYEVAVACLGKDASPQDLADDDVGCAESVDNVYYRAFGHFISGKSPVTLSTTELYKLMRANSTHFQATLDFQPGCIIVSPTGLGNGNLSNGHTGIVGKDNIIMSNDSATGLFRENFTIDTWIKRYRGIGGFPIYLFKPV